jgi:hypothetical protein
LLEPADVDRFRRIIRDLLDIASASAAFSSAPYSLTRIAHTECAPSLQQLHSLTWSVFRRLNEMGSRTTMIRPGDENALKAFGEAAEMMDAIDDRLEKTGKREDDVVPGPELTKMLRHIDGLLNSAATTIVADTPERKPRIRSKSPGSQRRPLSDAEKKVIRAIIENPGIRRAKDLVAKCRLEADGVDWKTVNKLKNQIRSQRYRENRAREK